MNNILYIPERINVGYQERTDTYTNKLGYVIYWDEKGKLRKETSWQNWRNNKLGSDAFDNKPTTGFILNRNGGGTRDYYYWNARAEFVRVWDPRGFEFEISIPNLLFILSETDCSRGKGLEGEFVYGWNGADLVLLPLGSSDYKKSIEYTNKQYVKIDRKNMVIGGTYTLKKDKELKPYIYMGKMNYFNHSYHSVSNNKMEDVFAIKHYNGRHVFVTKQISALGECIDNTSSEKYAELLEEYEKSTHTIQYELEYELKGIGYSNNYLNKFKDTSLFEYDVKRTKLLNDYYFKFNSQNNHITNGYITNDKIIKQKFRLLNYYRSDDAYSSKNVEHYEVFVKFNGLRLKLEQFISHFDTFNFKYLSKIK